MKRGRMLCGLLACAMLIIGCTPTVDQVSGDSAQLQAGESTTAAGTAAVLPSASPVAPMATQTPHPTAIPTSSPTITTSPTITSSPTITPTPVPQAEILYSLNLSLDPELTRCGNLDDRLEFWHQHLFEVAKGYPSGTYYYAVERESRPWPLAVESSLQATDNAFVNLQCLGVAPDTAPADYHRSESARIYQVDAPGEGAAEGQFVAEGMRYLRLRVRPMHPEGEFQDLIAFSSDAVNVGGNLYLTDAAGSFFQMLELQARHFAWSPDGTRIVYVVGSDILSYSLESGGIQIIVPDAGANPASLTWSPAGDSIAYGSHDGLWISDLQGAKTQLVAAGNVSSALWSPDGSHIAYSIFDQIYIAPLEDGDPIDLKASPSGLNLRASWSPDGSMLAYASENDIYVVRQDGTGLRRLTTGGWRRQSDYPDWSPDGTKIVYQHMNRIWIMESDGSGQVQLADVYGESPAWSPDGSKIGFVGANTVIISSASGVVSVGFEIYVMEADGSGLTNITADDFSDERVFAWQQ